VEGKVEVKQTLCKIVLLVSLVAAFCNCTAPRIRVWGSPESRSDLATIAGPYYMGDHLGINIRIGLALDRSYRATWYGCLGLYGESAGLWSFSDSLLVLKAICRREAMADFPDSLIILRSGSNLALLPMGSQCRKLCHEFGVDNLTCLEKDTSRAFIPQSALADLNCDGLPDLVVGANSDTAFTLRLYLGPLLDTAESAELTFRKPYDGCRDCICGNRAIFEKDVLVQIDSLLDSVPNGYEANANCAQIIVYSPEGECDRFHCYWNHATNKLDWWSL
jgi:hypothetical protein